MYLFVNVIKLSSFQALMISLDQQICYQFSAGKLMCLLISKGFNKDKIKDSDISSKYL